MEFISSSKLTRDSDKIRSYFKKIKNATITTQDITILIPEWYLDHKLAKLGSIVESVCIFAIIDGHNNYGVSIAPILGKFSPSEAYSMVSVDGERYLSLPFHSGDVVIPNSTMLVNDNFMFDIFHSVYIQGKVPWFLSYEDLSNLLIESDKYAGSKVGSDPLTYEILTSMMARTKNRKIYYKSVINSREDLSKIAPTYVGINNRYYSFDTTASKIIGSYFAEGVGVAIVSPETESSVVSDKLRE